MREDDKSTKQVHHSNAPKPLDTIPSSNSTGTPDDMEALIEQLEREEQIEFRGEVAAAWVGAALAFGVGVAHFFGPDKAEEYFAGYLLEQSLSVDNLFVFLLVFKYFKTPVEYQSKVLGYGFVTAGVLRLIMVVLGVEIIQYFHPILLVFASLLVYSSLQLLLAGSEDDVEDLDNNYIVRLCSRVLSVSDHYDGDRFFTIEEGIRRATPLLLTLAVVELSDVVFAVDSVPAVFGITVDPFIVYTSNLFAIVSLRSIYSVLSIAMTKLQFLDKAVAIVLGFIGLKMAVDFGGYHLPTSTSLFVVASVLGGGVAASALFPPTEQRR